MNYKDYMWNFADDRQFMERIPRGLPPLIITVAITGGMHGKEVNPNLPETPDEQAEQTYESYKAGASIVHVHARDPSTGYSTPSTNPEHFYEINKKIRTKCPDIIINNTTGGGFGLSHEERIRSVEAKPELASLNTGPMVIKMKFHKRLPPLTGRPEDVLMDVCAPATFGDVEFFAQKIKERNIKPEVEIYHPGGYWFLDNLIRQNLISPPYLVQFVMGYMGGIYPTPKNLLAMIDKLPEDSMFEVIGVGPHQLTMITMAILLGGQVRVGMEDNVFYRRGELSTGNAQSVERVVRIAYELGREIATPLEARRMLCISEQPSQYELET